MARGRKPVPTPLKQLRGNPGKRPLNHDEPKPTRGIPPRPDWLTADAIAEWDRIAPELDRLGLLTVLDGAALGAYCQAVAELALATRALEAEGRVPPATITTDKGETVTVRCRQANPWVRLQRDAFARIRAFLAEFGLTPAARVRLKAPAVDGGEADPFAALMGMAPSDN